MDFKIVTSSLLLLAISASEARKIVGGSETSIISFPYAVSIQIVLGQLKFHKCGASILSEKYLLSAAHCHPGIFMMFTYARIGSTLYDEGGQLIKVLSFKSHPKFDKNTLFDDLAILKLGNNLHFFKPVKLASEDYDYETIVGEIATIIGWGRKSDTKTSPVSQRLNVGKISITSRDRCLDFYENVSESSICAGRTRDGTTGTCHGDSGGPLMLDDLQIAITSGGSLCDQSNIPGIYTKISPYANWIRSVIESK